MDALDELRRHPELKAEEKAALDFQHILGDYTRNLVATLLTAILCERVERFHGDPGDWHTAAQDLLENTLQRAVDAQLITYGKLLQVMRNARSTYRPSELLLQWGATLQWLEKKRKDEALKSFHARQRAA